ncbi:MAG: hypothetical protein ACXWR1_00620 [Bdellovibrionota bacterium]
MKMLLVLALALSSSAAFAQTCRDGDIAYFPVSGGETNSQIALVCKNGSYFAPSAPVVNRSCTEGQTEIWSTGGGDGEPVHTAYYVCHNGAFQEVNAAPSYPSTPARCKEGQKEYFQTGGGEGEPVVTEVFVCHNGRLVRTK